MKSCREIYFAWTVTSFLQDWGKVSSKIAKKCVHSNLYLPSFCHHMTCWDLFPVHLFFSFSSCTSYIIFFSLQSPPLLAHPPLICLSSSLSCFFSSSFSSLYTIFPALLHLTFLVFYIFLVLLFLVLFLFLFFSFFLVFLFILLYPPLSFFFIFLIVLHPFNFLFIFPLLGLSQPHSFGSLVYIASSLLLIIFF